MTARDPCDEPISVVVMRTWKPCATVSPTIPASRRHQDALRSNIEVGAVRARNDAALPSNLKTPCKPDACGEAKREPTAVRALLLDNENALGHKTE